MAPPNIPTVGASASSSPSAPPLPDKQQVKRPGPATSTRTASNSSIPTLSTTRLARQPSSSSSKSIALQQASLPGRRPVRPANPPSATRAVLPNPSLDPSQDHHRSDSGRSTGSSRSTATTDSFFLPQHPHALSRRLKDLPAPPSPSALADVTRQGRSTETAASALGLNVVLGSDVLPPNRLSRSKSSVSTTPTSPDEAGDSPLDLPTSADFPELDDGIMHAKGKLAPAERDGLDDFWQSDYSYARPSTDLNDRSLPPLMRSNAPIPPSRSQSLDPFAAPLDQHGPDLIQDQLSAENLLTPEESLGSATPLVAANLRKLNSQHLQADSARTSTYRGSASSTSPVLSPASTAQTPTRRSDGSARLAVPKVSLYEQPSAAASSSSSAIDRPSLNKSTSSLSASSTHEAERATLATASKRSSGSSSSSFRMTLTKQAKSFRNSFLFQPPAAGLTVPSPGSQSGPISQGSGPGLTVPSPISGASDSSSPNTSPQVEIQRPTASASPNARGSMRPLPRSSTSFIAISAPVSPQKALTAPVRTSQSSADAASVHSGTSSRLTSRPEPTTSRTSVPSSPRQPPTDYAKLEDRPRSRLSSRLMLHNTSWSMKMPHLKTKKGGETPAVKPVVQSSVKQILPRSVARRTKSTAALTTASAAAATSTLSNPSASALRNLKAPGNIDMPPSPLLTAEVPSVDSQISPTFAETFAFLNSHIDSPEQSPPSETTVAVPPKDIPATTTARSVGTQPKVASAPNTRRSSRDLRAAGLGLAPAIDLNKIYGPVSIAAKTNPQKEILVEPKPKDTLFDQLSTSPEAVYKTLVLPDPEPLPASQSLDSVAPKPSRGVKRFGHKKQISLGSATLISKSASRAAADLGKRAENAPVPPAGLPSLAGGIMSTRSSFSSMLPAFTPVDEESRFFDALTSPLSELPPSQTSQLSSEDDSVMPTFATATDFFAVPSTESSSPTFPRASASASTVSSAAAAASTIALPRRTSLSRRLSGVFDASRARSVKAGVASPPQSPRSTAAPLESIPARPETSLGFHIRNPLRRERKTSVTKIPALPQPKALAKAADAADGSRPSSAMRTMSPAVAIRKMSAGFRLDRTAPAAMPDPARPDTSLGFSTISSSAAKPRSFGSSFMAPTKSSMARSVQPSPPATRSTVRSASASSLATSETSRQQRSPQRPPNPPSSFRSGVGSGSRPSLFSTGSPSKSAPAPTGSAAGLESTIDSFGVSASALDSPEDDDIALPSLRTSSTTNDLHRRRTMSKPVLRPIRTSFADDRPFARPSSAMGFRSTMTNQDRKMSQPTLDMVDDREFLEALEQVRQVHRERIQAQAQEVENKTRLARLGMMSGHYLKTKVGSMLDDDDLAIRKVASNVETSQIEAGKNFGIKGAVSAVVPRLRHKRSASADAKLSRSRSISSTSRDSDLALDQRQKDIVRAWTDKKSPSGPPTTGLEWGVGKASGKLHDGTFVNDDDWKKEVKALFLIRELVQTERSYARHLGSLLSVVRKIQTSSGLGVKRKSTSNLFAAYSSTYTSKTASSAAPPAHINLLRTYLPQLIALSNAIVQKVEENPTSAGVGAAFDVLAAQLESTFVGWSSVASQALKDLRSTEQAKGKSPFKIGLVPLTPRESNEVGASTTDASGSSGNSSPGSGFRNSTLRMTSLTRPASPVKAEAEAINSIEASAGTTLPAKRSTKRRSTITSTSFIAPPRIIVATGSALTASPLDETGTPDARADDSARAGKRFTHVRSQSTLVTPLPTPVSATTAEPWSSSTSAPAPPSTGKSLTPTDIAIMPTQRIPRYGLMLRDLLRNTPPESLSHARVQRAIALVQKIAGLCDSAAPVVPLPASGAATPARASSVMGMASAESLHHVSPLLPASAFTMTKRA